MINLLLWLVFGALAGWLASLLTKTDAQQGAWGNIIVGILGALIGGVVSRMLGGPEVTGFNFSSLVIAVLGATFLLIVFRRAWR